MSDDTDQALRWLNELHSVLDENERRARAMRRRIAWIEARRSEGQTWRELVPEEVRPLVVELLSESAVALDQVGARVRRAEARILHDEGMTMDEIARHFGVTRQRVSGLLREARSDKYHLA